MTDLLIHDDPSDTGEIPVGEATENIAPYAEGLRPTLRSAEADRPAWAEKTVTTLPTLTVIPDLDSQLPALTYGTDTERMTLLDSLGAEDGWVSLPPEWPDRAPAYLGRHRDPRERIAVWGETSYEVPPAPVEVSPTQLRLGVGLMVATALGCAVYAGLVMAALVVIR